MSPILGIIASQNYPRITSSYESIATVSVGSGGQAEAEFTSIPSTYKHLQIRALIRGTASASAISLGVRFNSDTGSNYSYHELFGSGSSVGASGDANQTRILMHGNAPAANALASSFGVAIMDILEYKNTSIYKTARSLAGMDVNGTGGYALLESGNWRNTNAITSIKIIPSTGNLAQYSQFALYGIKD